MRANKTTQFIIYIFFISFSIFFSFLTHSCLEMRKRNLTIVTLSHDNPNINPDY